MRKTQIILLLLFLTSHALSGENNPQLNIMNTRSIGIGGSAVALPLDASAVYWNPATISFFTNDQILVNLNEYSKFNFIGFTKFLPARFGFGMNVFRFSAGDKISDLATIGGGYRINSAFGLGADVNVGKRHNGEFFSSFGFGLFLKSYPSYRPKSVSKNAIWSWFRSREMKDKLNLGVMIHNIPLVNADNSHEFRFAAMLKPLDYGPMIHFAYHVSHAMESFHLGSHLSINQRNDIYFGFKEFDIKKMAIGFNTTFDVFSFDFGFIPQSSKYFFSFSLLFSEDNQILSQRYKHAGHQKIKNNEFISGLSEYKKALAYDPDNDKINLLVSILEDRVERKKNRIDSLFAVAKDYKEKGWYVNAFHNYKTILKLNRTNKKAKKQIKKMQPELSNHLQQLYNEGVSKYKNNAYDEAEKTFRTILSVNNNHQGAKFYSSKIDSIKTLTFSEYFYRGIGYFNQKNYKRAEEELEKALTLKPDHEEARRYKERAINAAVRKKETIQQLLAAAQRYEENDEFVKANNRYRQILELDSGNDFARKKVAYLRNYISAVTDSKFQRGKQLFDKKEYQAAINVFSEITAINPNHRAAQKYLREARTKLSDMLDGHYQQALSYFKEKKYELAMEECNRVLAMGGNHRGAENLQQQILSNISNEKLQKQGIEYFENGYYLKARETFGRILGKEPNHKIASDYLKRLDYKLENKIEELFNQGMVNYSEGDYNAAIDVWNRILQIDPYHQRALEFIQKASERLEALDNIK